MSQGLLRPRPSASLGDPWACPPHGKLWPGRAVQGLASGRHGLWKSGPGSPVGPQAHHHGPLLPFPTPPALTLPSPRHPILQSPALGGAEHPGIWMPGLSPRLCFLAPRGLPPSGHGGGIPPTTPAHLCPSGIGHACGRRARPSGACSDRAPPRPQFFTCLVILFACEVAAGIWGFVNKDQIAKDVKQFYDQALQQAIVDDDANNAKAVVKTFHETLNCCGSNTLTTLTTSVLKNSLCPSGGNIISNLMKEDCHSKIDELFSGKLYLIGIAAIVVAVIMIFEMILSMVLCCGIRNSSVY
uniref:CD81 molecule n=1 Tax=Sus scrofa TaxID=9823 RepID=A0A8D0Y8G6_PIG